VRRHRRASGLGVGALLVAASVIAGACGSDPPRELAGYRREPAPSIGELSLPDLTAAGEDFNFRADPGHLLVVYFGYTNCPDFCPTTLSDLKLATRRMKDADAARIDVAMATVDPERDLPILPDYIASFFDDGHALGTDDGRRLAEVAAPFGVSYNISEAADGSVEVSHTTSLYVVDDTGHLALTWQFGVSIDDLAADLTQLLESSSV
jgi:protein SCO1/2